MLPVRIARWVGRHPKPGPMPRRLRVQRDYPRAAACWGRPVLDGARYVTLPALFPRERTVSDGQGHQSLRWLTRSRAHAVASHAARGLS
jgi:hypothetical protein